MSEVSKINMNGEIYSIKDESARKKADFLDEHKASKEEVEVERQRINNLASLPNGSTIGDAELIDARVGADGITYPSAGEAIRSQIGALSGVKVSETEPTSENVEIWVNPNEDESYNVPEIKDDQISEEDTWSSSKINSELTELKGDLDYRFTSVKSAQLLDISQCIVGKALESVGGVSTPYDLIDASTNVVSNIICKEKGKRITFATNMARTSGCSLLGYIKNNKGDYVRADYYSGVTIGERYNTITFSENAELIRMDIPIGEWNRLNIIDGGWYFCKEEDWTADISREYVNYSYLANTKVKEESILLENPINYKGNEVSVFFYGIACGDSLTEGTFNTESGFENHKQYAYPVFFNKKTGVTLRNFGVGGSTAKSWYERYQNVEFPIYDFAIIAFGVNDLLQGVDDTTINYLTNIVNKLKSKNPKVKCFIATVNKAYKSASANYDILNENIRDFVNATDGCYLLDIAKYGLTEEGTDFVNGHLTAIGYNELAREYENLISWNIHNNMSDFADIQFSGTTYTSLPTD